MFSVCSAKISVCKQNLSAESPRTRSHFSFFRVQLHFLIQVFSGTDHKQVRNQWPLTPNCTNTCRFPAKFVTHFLNAFHSLSGCDTPNFSSLFLIFKHKLQQQCGVSPGETKPISLPVFLLFYYLRSLGTSNGKISEKNSVSWASVFKAAAYKNPYGKNPFACGNWDCAHS